MIFKKLTYFILCIFICQACSVKYSFSGKSISPETKTFSVAYIQNRAPLIQPTLSDVFTEGIKEKFRSQAGLSLISKNGDLHFEGDIVDYSITYQGVTANQQAAQNRLTISVTITCTNNVEPAKSYTKKFTSYRDFSAQESLSSVEDLFIEEMSKEIIEEIFLKSVADW